MAALYFFILLYLLILLCKFVIAYIKLVYRYNKQNKLFIIISNKSQEYYNIIQQIIDQTQNIMIKEKTCIDNIIRLKYESENLKDNLIFINRKIAFDNELYKQMKRYIKSLSECNELKSNKNIEDLIQKYSNEVESNNIIKSTYNQTVLELKNLVNTFPASFIARLKRIKYADFFYFN